MYLIADEIRSAVVPGVHKNTRFGPRRSMPRRRAAVAQQAENKNDFIVRRPIRALARISRWNS